MECERAESTLFEKVTRGGEFLRDDEVQSYISGKVEKERKKSIMRLRVGENSWTV